MAGGARCKTLLRSSESGRQNEAYGLVPAVRCRLFRAWSLRNFCADATHVWGAEPGRRSGRRPTKPLSHHNHLIIVSVLCGSSELARSPGIASRTALCAHVDSA